MVQYYGIVKDGVLDGIYGLPCVENEHNHNVIATEEQYNNAMEYGQNYYIVEDDTIVLNPNYEQEEQQKEAERISHLKATKRVIALMLQQLGISYSQLKSLIATNEQAQLEWELCVELERCNPLLDVMGQQLGLTSQQIDQMFKYANGEVESLEVV